MEGIIEIDKTQTPRADGKCVVCINRLAVTTDKLRCLRCLRRKINDENPDPAKQPTEGYGRSSISTLTLGGAPDMRTTEERTEDDDRKR